MFVREGKGVGVVVEGRSVGLMQSAIGLWQCRLAVGWRKKGLRRGTITISSSVANCFRRSGKKTPKTGAKKSKKGSSAVRCSHWGSNQHQCDQQALRTIDFGWHAKPKATIVTKCPFVVFPAAYLKGRSGLALR